jgi:hypothetical protein
LGAKSPNNGRRSEISGSKQQLLTFFLFFLWTYFYGKQSNAVDSSSSNCSHYNWYKLQCAKDFM